MHEVPMLSTLHNYKQKKIYAGFHDINRHIYDQCNTHTHPFNSPLSSTSWVRGTRKVKPIWILLEQETVSGISISWAICKSASRSRQITIIIIIIKGIYIAQVRKGHKCAMSSERAVWLRNCLYLYSYLSHN